MNSTNNDTAKTAIDFRTLPACVPSLCIPRVYPNISETRIRKIFNDLDLGVIERIDIISKTTEKGERFNRVFIHMEQWFQNGNACFARERLLGGKDIKVIYDDPWFWKISAYREGCEINKERRQPKVFDMKPLRHNNNNNNNNNNARKVKREDIEEKPYVKEERKPYQRDVKEEKPVSLPAVQYDPTVGASTKKRVIIIKKEPLVHPGYEYLLDYGDDAQGRQCRGW